MRTAIAILALLLGPALAASPPASELTPAEVQQATRLVRKAEQAWRGKRIQAARGLYAQALEVAPAFPEARLGLGHIAIRDGDFGDALRHYEAARDGYASLRRELQDFRNQRYARVQAEIRDLRDAIRTLSNPSTSRGDAAYQIAKLQNRIDILRALDPPAADAAEPPGEVHFYIGNALYRLDRINRAIAAWELCRERSPRFAMNHNNLALAYWQTGQLDEAVESLRTAERLGFPVDPGFRTGLLRAAAVVADRRAAADRNARR